MIKVVLYSMKTNVPGLHVKRETSSWKYSLLGITIKYFGFRINAYTYAHVQLKPATQTLHFQPRHQPANGV